ncbi:MAG: hypothetical protein RL497_277 [Pseudomonadota bacterium]|jgi:hypothetical protein
MNDEPTLASAITQQLNKAVEQQTAATQAALAAGRKQALKGTPVRWHWAIAASVVLALGAITWRYEPADIDNQLVELLQADDQLLNDLDLLEALAEVDET